MDTQHKKPSPKNAPPFPDLLLNKLEYILEAAHVRSWDLNLENFVIKRLGSNVSDELTYDMFLNKIHKEDYEKTKLEIQTAITNESSLNLKFRIRQADDESYRWIHLRGKYCKFNNERHMLGIIENITEAKEQEEALRLSEERLRFLINSTQDYAIYMLDPHGIINTWSEAAAHIHGYAAEEVLGKHFSLFSTEESIQHHHPHYELYHARQKGRHEEKNWRVRKDGTRFWAHIILNPFYNNENELVGYAKIVRDLTEQELIEKKLDSILELRRSNQELEQFAYVASHDLKAPLRSIQSLISWIEKDSETKLSEESMQNFSLLVSRVKRLSYLIDGILQYSRVGRVDLAITTISVKHLLREVVDTLNPPSNITIHFPKDLPTIAARRIPLLQVFTNLICNAIKYNDKSEGQIHIGVKEKKKYFEFCVADNGPGIDAQFHQKIFEIFQTLQSRDEVESAGIGLSIVRKIVESQGGRIYVKSQVGKGAAFMFTWPKEVSRDSAEHENKA